MRQIWNNNEPFGISDMNNITYNSKKNSKDNENWKCQLMFGWDRKILMLITWFVQYQSNCGFVQKCDFKRKIFAFDMFLCFQYDKIVSIVPHHTLTYWVILTWTVTKFRRNLNVFLHFISNSCFLHSNFNVALMRIQTERYCINMKETHFKIRQN